MKKNPISIQPNVDKILEYLPDDFTLAADSEKENFIELRKSTSYWQDAWRRLKRNGVAMVALGVLLLTFLFAFLGPVVIPYTNVQQVRGSENLYPLSYSAQELAKLDAGESVFPHLFGTDQFGRDLLVRNMHATRISLIIGVTASLIVLVIGTLYGSISGYAGGKVDFVMMRIVDMVYALPEILVVLLLSSILKVPLQNLLNSSSSALIRGLSQFGSGVVSIFIVFGLLFWVGSSRIIRGQILSLKRREFVTAAKALGASSPRIIRKHLLPNCIGQIIVTTMMQIPSAIFLESFLSFLGLGVSAPVATLGSLCSDALGGMRTYPSRLIIPSIILSIIILCFNLFGDGLRDALDPRMKR
ncbi:MAG: ABC transporter permease [Oscillospiraceae bacterium]|jgi:oligopeptide transport system permease protein|nr:ABC transporter permease [Oscillospiraceae bacterium]